VSQLLLATNLGNPTQPTSGSIPGGGVNVTLGLGLPAGTDVGDPLFLNLPPLPPGSGPPVLYEFVNGAWQKVLNQTAGGGWLMAHLDDYGYYQIFAPILDQPFSFGEVFVYPNPTKDVQVPTLHIEVGQADKVTTRVYDVSGGLVFEGRVDELIVTVNGKLSYEYAFDPKLFTSGVYTGEVTAEKAGIATIRKEYRFTVIK
jgi:hypothetical protein